MIFFSKSAKDDLLGVGAIFIELMTFRQKEE
jgi:hypothetical protein